ncbi:hypothetical protein JTE90_008430 [Oedothorax gibbosus]|uniref:Uncharacterized protein n=1 Tax=Oedothorax gibbosus TaxID=931172 RepID=A0AAV6UUV1_9ARAC|nr:hypothetical protein JTE90_008430 [Oedothorax gibbosus]
MSGLYSSISYTLLRPFSGIKKGNPSVVYPSLSPFPRQRTDAIRQTRIFLRLKLCPYYLLLVMSTSDVLPRGGITGSMLDQQVSAASQKRRSLDTGNR